MTDTVHKVQTATGSRKRSLPGRVIRFFVLGGLAFLLLLVALLLFSETEYFRTLARNTIIGIADSALNAHLSIGHIEGNIFSGWDIRDVSLNTATGPIVRVRSIVVRYDISTILWKRIDVAELRLNAPEIFVTKGTSGRWNIENLVRDTVSTPSSGTAFDWRIILRSLRVVDARVLVWDSTSQELASFDHFDSRHLDLRDLRLALSADIAQGERALSITELAFRNAAGFVSLMSCTADIKSKRDRTTMDLLSIRTQNSGLLLSGTFQGADLLADTAFSQLADRRFSFDATAMSLDTRDLRYFLPSLDFMAGEPSFSVRLSGSLRELNIESFALQVEGSQLTFRGRLLDVGKGGDMIIDVESGNTVIVASDVNKVLPGLELPDYSSAGTAVFQTLRFKGKPLDFLTEIDMKSDAGELKGIATMDMTGPDVIYDYDVTLRGMDLARLFRKPMLSSSLNVRMNLHGRNFSPGRAVAEATIFIDSSRFQRYETDSVSVSLRIRPDSLHMDIRSALGRSRVNAEASLAFIGDSVGGFALRANARSLDLAKALNRDDLASDLTFGLTANGTGLNLSDASADIRFTLAPSRFADRVLESDTLHLQLDQRNKKQRQLFLTTRYADVRVDGEFDIRRFVVDIARSADSIAAGVGRFRSAADSAITMLPALPRFRASKPQPSMRIRRMTRPVLVEDTASYMRADYRVVLKHTEALTRYFGAQVFILLGSLDGNIRGGPNGFDIDGRANITDAYFVDSSKAMIAAGLRLDYSLSHLRFVNAFEEMVLDLRFAAQDFEMNGFHLANIGVRASSALGVPRLRVQGMLDSVLQVVLDGVAKKENNAWAVSFPLFQLEYLGKKWVNPDTVRVIVNDSSANIESLRLGRNGTLLSLSGNRGFSGKNNLKLELDGLPLAELDSVLSRYDVAVEDHRFTGTASVTAELQGTDSAPHAAVELFIRDLGYRQMIFEEFQFEARYEQEMLELYSSLRPYPVDGKRKTSFFASGSVPIHFSLAGDSAVSVFGEANLRLKMTDFPVALVEKFVRIFSPLSGDANADLTVQGTIDKFRYAGFLTVSNARGRFILNNMTYDLGLKVEPKGNSIIIRELTVRNDPKDWESGRMTAKGELDMAGFQLRQFTLEVDGRLKVLKPESRSAIKALYGELYIMTSDHSVRYHAEEGKSELTGSIKITEGNLTYASENQGNGAKQHSNIRYLDVDDRAKEKRTSLSMSAKGGKPSLKGRALETDSHDSLSHPEHSIFDALSYSISVSTDGALRIVMPFSSLSQEELNARLNINDLKIANFLGSGTFSGEVTLGPGSYYSMLGQRFLASGSLEFVGDAQNPELKLRAIYSDYHTDRLTGVRRQVFVIITINGTRLQPKLTWDLRLDSPDGPTTGADVQSDAFSFVLLGLFTDELTSADPKSVVSKAEAIGKAIASNIVSSKLTEWVDKAGLKGILRRVELGNLGTQDARVKMTSEIGRFLVMYDGKINNLASSDFSVEIPLSMVLPNIGLGSMVIQASRKTSSTSLESSTASQETSNYELKLLYRFSF